MSAPWLLFRRKQLIRMIKKSTRQYRSISKGFATLIQYALVGVNEYYVEISNEHFELIKLTRSRLFEALSIEDKLNLVLENYAEFEQEMFNCSVKKMLFSTNAWSPDAWSSFIDDIHMVNRRIINLLTTCRLYIDQTSHNICSIYGANSDQETAIKKRKSQEYDSDCPAYRVMEAMRNYVQHRELPIRRLSHNWQRIENGLEVLAKRTIELSIDIETLSEDKKFKRAVLAELQDLGESVEFTPLLRQYLESIGRIHLKMREILSPDLPQWEEIIQRPITRYQEATGCIDGLRAVSIDESKITETISIFSDFIKRRQMLESKNQYLTHYSSNFISSEAPKLKTD
ncbi:MAG: hypothetical protein RBJ76_11655 [Stenomitos frigidus ULC029]